MKKFILGLKLNMIDLIVCGILAAVVINQGKEIEPTTLFISIGIVIVLAIVKLFTGVK